mgnify:CR=1 FL=1
MSYIGKPKVTHPGIRRNKLGLTPRDYEGTVSTLCAGCGHDSVTAYRADPATGQLTVVDVEPIRGAWPRNINMDASGKWLLAAGQHSNTVSVMAIDPASGELTYLTDHVINVPAPLCILPVE